MRKSEKTENFIGYIITFGVDSKNTQNDDTKLVITVGLSYYFSVISFQDIRHIGFNWFNINTLCDLEMTSGYWREGGLTP